MKWLDQTRDRLIKWTEHPIHDVTMGTLTIIWIMSLLVQLLSQSDPLAKRVDDFIYIVFVCDFLFRFLISRKRIAFVRQNWIEAVSILPFGLIAQSARFLLILRIFIAIKRFFSHIRDAFLVHGLFSVLIGTILFVCTMGLSVFYLEPETFKHSIENAIWWSFVTATTVGYGDFYPVTQWGRLIGVILMFSGMGMVGIASGMMSNYFVSVNREKVLKSPDVKKQSHWTKRRKYHERNVRNKAMVR